jgi:Spy/CpxP family protein refolding chaperone
MKKTIVALGLLAVLLFGVTYVFAQNPGHGHRGGPPQEGWGPGKWSSLTPEQKTKAQELHRKFNEETAQLRGSILTKRLELQSLWTNPKADSKTIMDKEKEVRDLQNQMKDKMIQFKLEARKFLTPEQIQESGQGRGRGFGRGHMMGHGRGMGPEHGMCN